MGNENIIKIEHISKSFDGVQVLNDINLDIRKGEFVTLLGPSGCGKTTMLRMLAGFTKPDSGKIVMEGQDITDIPPHRRPLNTVFQKYALFPHLDVYDNIAFGLKLAKVPQDEIDKRVRKALKMVTTGIIETSYGVHVMYFDSFGKIYRDALVENALRSADYNAWYEATAGDGSYTTSAFGMKYTTK